MTALKGVKQKDLIFDVGMHKGEDTEYYLKTGFRVVAFEASPSLAEKARNRFRAEIESGDLVIVEGAIVPPHQGDGTVTFYQNTEYSAWGTISSDWAERNRALGSGSQAIEVAPINFSECLAHYGVPYYLKIDIEGMDRVCLEALADFNVVPDYVSIESEKRSYSALLDEISLLESLGYSGFKAVQQEQMENRRAPIVSLEGRSVDHRFTEGSSGTFGRDISGSWLGSNDIRRRYRKIFREYTLFGDYGWLSGNLLGRAIRKALKILLRRPLPGWYDTHARHKGAD